MGTVTELTVEAWYKTDVTTGGLRAIVSSPGGQLFHFQVGPAGNVVVHTNTGVISLPLVPTSPIGQWRHAALSVKSGDTRMYIDGVETGSSTHVYNYIEPSSEVCIGRGFGQARYFHGSIDEVRMWNVARSQADIVANMHKRVDVCHPDLEAYYTLDEGTAGGNNTSLSTAIDLTAQGHNGTLMNFNRTGAASNWIAGATAIPPLTATLENDYNGTANASDVYPVGTTTVTWTATDGWGNSSTCETYVTVDDVTDPFIACPSNISVQSEPGLCSAQVTVPTALASDNCGNTGNALHFDGSNDYISLPGTFGGNSGGTMVDEVTVEAWFKTSSSSNALKAILSSPTETFLHCQVGIGGSLAVYTDAGTILLPLPQDAPVNEWRHLAVSVKPMDTRVYVDGVQTGSSNLDFNYILENDNVTIGRGFNNIRYFPGSIDEVRVWNVARTAAEIANYKNLELTGNEPGLEFYYSFNQVTINGNNSGISTLTDAGLSNSDGTLHGFALTGNTSN